MDKEKPFNDVMEHMQNHEGLPNPIKKGRIKSLPLGVKVMWFIILLFYGLISFLLILS